MDVDAEGGTWLISIDHTSDNKATLGVNGTVNAEILYANDHVQVGNAKMATDGNIWGTRWTPGGGWLWDAIMAQMNNFIRGVQVGPRVAFWSGAEGWSDQYENLIPQGAVSIAAETVGDDRINRVVYAYVMVNIGGNWVNAG
ncbi:MULTISPECIES: hypothetical protein [unclassified Serratia (in: enterobacteria)]|uniref:hypothetical protein n=1 Tax=unclassified Serratia (in: enterobacteria) TaxID=2647522 RepID=UPI003B42B11A